MFRGENMNKVMKIVDVVAFIILLLGGLNFFIYGVFGVDVMELIFGAELSVVGRIIYAIIGSAALLLLATVIARVIMKNRQVKAAQSAFRQKLSQGKPCQVRAFFVMLAMVHASLAQLDRVFGFEPNGWGFDSLTTHQFIFT